MKKKNQMERQKLTKKKKQQSSEKTTIQREIKLHIVRLSAISLAVCCPVY